MVEFYNAYKIQNSNVTSMINFNITFKTDLYYLLTAFAVTGYVK